MTEFDSDPLFADVEQIAMGRSRSSVFSPTHVELAAFILSRTLIQCAARVAGAPFYRTQILLQSDNGDAGSMVSCMKNVAQTEGIWRGLFMRTAGPQCVSVLLRPAVVMLLQAVVPPHYPSRGNITAIATQLILYPLDMAVVLICADRTNKHNGLFGCLANVVQERGAWQLYRGVVFNVLAQYIFDATYDVLYRLLLHNEVVLNASGTIQLICIAGVTLITTGVLHAISTACHRMIINTDMTQSTTVALCQTIVHKRPASLFHGFVAKLMWEATRFIVPTLMDLLFS